MANPLPTQDNDPYSDRRSSPRVTVALPAFLQAKGERHFVHILDLSAGGAKLKCPVNLAKVRRCPDKQGQRARAVLPWAVIRPIIPTQKRAS